MDRESVRGRKFLVHQQWTYLLPRPYVDESLSLSLSLSSSDQIDFHLLTREKDAAENTWDSKRGGNGVRV